MNLSGDARRLFKLIENFIRNSRRAFRASQRWVAAHFGVSIRTVKRWYAELRAAQVFDVRRRRNRSSEIIILRPLLALPVALPVALPYKESSILNLSGNEQHHRDDAASSLEEPVRKAAGMENLSEGDRRYLREMERSGVTPEEARAGVLVGRARRMIHTSNGGSREPIRSVRYFAGPIREAQAGAFPAAYVDRIPQWLERAAQDCECRTQRATA